MHWSDRPYEWVGDWSARRATLSPDREALVDWTSGERYTYARLDERANRTARLLREYGVAAASPAGTAEGSVGERPGERVAVVSRNRVEVVDLFFATGTTGGVLAPLSHRLAAPELGELLDLVEPLLLVVEAPFTGLVADALADAHVDPAVLQLLAADEGGSAQSGGAAAEHGADGSDVTGTDADGTDGDDGAEATPLPADPYHDALPADDAPVDPVDQALDDVHLLLHTGGSTGTPKETAITHGTICWNSLNTITAWGLREDDVAPMAFPTFHTGGWNVLTLPLVHLGARIVIDREVDPGRLLEQIEQEAATVFVAVPAVLRAMTEHEDWADADLDSLRFVKSGGGPCRESVIEAWRERGVDLSQGYGLTECGPNNFAMPDDWPPEKVASVGKPALHVDARLVDEDGAPVPRGEVGELELAGQHAAAGYWRDEAETAAAFGPRRESDASGERDTSRDSDAGDAERGGQRGWVSTGDLFRVDADGYYHFVGRTKAMFVSGGENVYPPVVEDAIAEHPAVADAVVVGIPDERWGTVGKAVVEPATNETVPSLAELQSFLEDRLAGYEVPASVAVTDELPTSGPGKIDREAVEAEFGAGAPR